MVSGAAGGRAPQWHVTGLSDAQALGRGTLRRARERERERESWQFCAYALFLYLFI